MSEKSIRKYRDADQLPSQAPERYTFPFPFLLSMFPYENSLTSLSVNDCN